jgi:hypothetical protein
MLGFRVFAGVLTSAGEGGRRGGTKAGRAIDYVILHTRSYPGRGAVDNFPKEFPNALSAS